MTVRQTPVYSASTKVLLAADASSTSSSSPTTRASTADARPAAQQRDPDHEQPRGPRRRSPSSSGATPRVRRFSPLEGTDVVEISVAEHEAEARRRDRQRVRDTYIEVRRDLDRQGPRRRRRPRSQDQHRRASTHRSPRIDADLDAASDPPPRQRAERPTRDDPRRERLAAPSAATTQTQLNKLQIGDRRREAERRRRSSRPRPCRPRRRTESPLTQHPRRPGHRPRARRSRSRSSASTSTTASRPRTTSRPPSGQTVIGLIPRARRLEEPGRDPAHLDRRNRGRPRPRPTAPCARRSSSSSLDQPIGSLQVTSAMAGEGKTTTLANLAVTFARVGQRVIVLCCDLRRPRVHEFFGLVEPRRLHVDAARRRAGVGGDPAGARRPPDRPGRVRAARARTRPSSSRRSGP